MDTLIYLAIGVLAFSCFISPAAAVGPQPRDTQGSRRTKPGSKTIPCIPGDFISDNKHEKAESSSGQRIEDAQRSTLNEPLIATTTTTTTTLPTSFLPPLERIRHARHSGMRRKLTPVEPTVPTADDLHPFNMQSQWKLPPSLSGVTIDTFSGSFPRHDAPLACPSPRRGNFETGLHKPPSMWQVRSAMPTTGSNLAARIHAQAPSGPIAPRPATQSTQSLPPIMANIRRESKVFPPPLIPISVIKDFPKKFGLPPQVIIPMVDCHHQRPTLPESTISGTSMHGPMPGAFPMEPHTRSHFSREVDQVLLDLSDRPVEPLSLPPPASNPKYVPRASFNVPGVLWKPSLLPPPTLDPNQAPPARPYSYDLPARPLSLLSYAVQPLLIPLSFLSSAVQPLMVPLSLISSAVKLPSVHGDAQIDPSLRRPQRTDFEPQAPPPLDTQLDYHSSQRSIMPSSKMGPEHRQVSIIADAHDHSIPGSIMPPPNRDSNHIPTDAQGPNVRTSLPRQDTRPGYTMLNLEEPHSLQTGFPAVASRNVYGGESAYDSSLQGFSFHNPLRLNFNTHSNTQRRSGLDQGGNTSGTNFQFIPTRRPMTLSTEGMPSTIRPEYRRSKEARLEKSRTTGNAASVETKPGRNSIKDPSNGSSRDIKDGINGHAPQIKGEGSAKGVGCQIPPANLVAGEPSRKKQGRPAAAGSAKTIKSSGSSLRPKTDPRPKLDDIAKYVGYEKAQGNLVSDETPRKKGGQRSAPGPDKTIKLSKRSSLPISKLPRIPPPSAISVGQTPQVVRSPPRQDCDHIQSIQTVTAPEHQSFNKKGTEKADLELQRGESPKSSSRQPLTRWLRKKMGSNIKASTETVSSTLCDSISKPGNKTKLPKPNSTSRFKSRDRSSRVHNTSGEQSLIVHAGESTISKALIEGELTTDSTLPLSPHTCTISTSTQPFSNRSLLAQPSRIPIRSRSSPAESSQSILQLSSPQNSPVPSGSSLSTSEGYVDPNDDHAAKSHCTRHTFPSSHSRKRPRRELDSDSLRVIHLRQSYLSKVHQSNEEMTAMHSDGDESEQDDDQHGCFL